MLFDYAASTCGVPGKDFVKLFIASSVSKRMENGEPICLVGKSGIEIARGKKTKFQAKSQK